MKTKYLIIPLSALMFSSIVFAFASNGDSYLDMALSELNATARLDFGSYRAEIALDYNLSTSKIDYLYLNLKMEPADIFMVAELASVSKIPIDNVVTIYQTDKAKGWGHIAQKLGIKPGSAEFKALKNKAANCSGKLKNKGGKGKNFKK